MSNPPDWLLHCLKGPDNPSQVELCFHQWREVRTLLKRMPVSSAPGPNRLPYKVWKVLDPDGDLLALIFEICYTERRIPGAWIVSTTVLIYKKGEESISRNWRLISAERHLLTVHCSLVKENC